jgi:hypothetical protein
MFRFLKRFQWSGAVERLELSETIERDIRYCCLLTCLLVGDPKLVKTLETKAQCFGPGIGSTRFPSIFSM